MGARDKGLSDKGATGIAVALVRAQTAGARVAHDADDELCFAERAARPAA